MNLWFKGVIPTWSWVEYLGEYKHRGQRVNWFDGDFYIRQGSTNIFARKESRKTSSGLDQQSEVASRSRAESLCADTSPSSVVHREEAKPIVIDGREDFGSVAFLVDGKHVVSGDVEGRVQFWRVEDGAEVRVPITVGHDAVWSIAVSGDGRWIVSGMKEGSVTVWNAETYEKVREFKGHDRWVCAVDVSPDSRRITTGSADNTACVWLLSTGERLLGPWEHTNPVVTTRFSPGSGSLIATAASPESVRVYDGLNGRLRVDVAIPGISSSLNASFVWSSDSKRLFALSGDSNIHTIDVSTGTTPSKWAIHSTEDVRCIAIAANDMFIAASAGRAVSLWDTTTHEQIGPTVKFTHRIWSMGISNLDLVVGGAERISLRNLRDVLLSPSFIDHAVALAKTVEELRTQLSESQQAENNLLQTLRVQEEASRNSTEIVKDLRNELAKTQSTAEGYREIVSSLQSTIRAQEVGFSNRIALLEQSVQDLHVELAESKQEATRLSRINHIYEQMHKCESLYANGRLHDLADSILEIVNTASKDVVTDKLVSDQILEFTDRCTKGLEMIGDEASRAGKLDDAVAAYSILLSVGSSIPNALLMKWASAVLIGGPVKETLRTARRFKCPTFSIYRAICDTLEGDGRLTEAIECFRCLQHELPDDVATKDERAPWEQDFLERCTRTLEKLGDTARDSHKHEEAIEYYSKLLLLDPANFNVLLKRSNEIIELDPSSHKGYKNKHAALHGMCRYREAFDAFLEMVSKLEQSPSSDIRMLRDQYVDATPVIQNEVNKAIHDMPTVLIDTETGHLYDKGQQGGAFKELPIYDELRSSMTTQLDLARIRTEVKLFYRYVMFSHRWQPHEPSFQEVQSTSVYKLPRSLKFSKLQSFCTLVCSLRFKWAWTDTCCVNQLDKGVQQESVVAMFRWYRGSALTIVHLLGIFSDSAEIDRLRRSIWNTRGWTYQEYVASEVVQFYTDDWKPYLGLSIFNHKESSDVLLEMEQAMNFTTKQLTTIQPGLERAREKLYLASTRQTTRQEDIAYSLFGIFNVALPVIYGEGLQAVGRLLEHVLTRSGDVTLLAWIGIPGSHHSYLPVDLTVYNQIIPPHIPSPIDPAKMDATAAALRSSLPDISKAISLYDRLYDLPPLSLISGRLKLSGIVFHLHSLVLHSESDSESDLPVYHVTTPMLGDVEISTATDLSEMGRLLLIHPWISPLLDRDFSYGEPQFDPATCALRLIVRLRQPFGALLLASCARAQYKRVATDSLIMVRIREEVPLEDLLGGIRTVDIQ